MMQLADTAGGCSYSYPTFRDVNALLLLSLNAHARADEHQAIKLFQLCSTSPWFGTPKSVFDDFEWNRRLTPMMPSLITL